MKKYSFKKMIGLALLILLCAWCILIGVSNYYDGPIRYPAPKSYLDMTFNEELSLKYCVFNNNNGGDRRLGVVIIVDGQEKIIPLQESHRNMIGGQHELFSSSYDMISDMKKSKELTRKLLTLERESTHSTQYYDENEVTLLPFLDETRKFVHGTNSKKHHRNAKRITVKKWFPVVSKLFINPYNFLLGDRFYSEIDEETDFGFFHGNNINMFTTNDTINLPKGIEKVDIEAELGIVIGKTGQDININEADEYIAGFLIYNDISDRVTQDNERTSFLGYQKSKYLNSFGAYMVTDIDPEKFAITAYVNDIEMFTCSSNEIMEFMSIEEQIVAYSRFGGLVTGQLIGTGTMAGGSLNELELEHVKAGDKIELVGNQGLDSLINYIQK